MCVPKCQVKFGEFLSNSFSSRLDGNFSAPSPLNGVQKLHEPVLKAFVRRNPFHTQAHVEIFQETERNVPSRPST